MGSQPSTLEKHNFTLVKKEGLTTVVKSSEGRQYVVRCVNNSSEDIFTVREIIKALQHPHIIGHQQSFKDGDEFYVLVDYYEGRNLLQRIQRKREQEEKFSDEEIMDYFVKILMALRHLHVNNLVHRDLRAQNIFFTEFGTACLGELPEITERAGLKNDLTGELSNIPPEILKGGTYHDKSDVWSLGCLLYELCMLKTPFAQEDAVKMVPKILSGAYATVSDTLSGPLKKMLAALLEKDPMIRPSAEEVLRRPFVLATLISQCERTVEELQGSVTKLRNLADGLESVHFGTTVGSLAGGVIGAAGGITSIVGLILAPFTLGASLIVTGVGVGVAAAGGATAGISNITNMVNQSTDRQNVKNIIREFEEKLNSVLISFQHISQGLESSNLLEPSSAGEQSETGINPNGAKVGMRMGRGLGAIPELVRLAQVANLGKVAAQTARAVRVAEVATGIFSAFFLAVDVFFIAMDAREIHRIRQTQSDRQEEDGKRQRGENHPGQLRMSENTLESSDMAMELIETTSTTELQPTSEVKSETMKFVLKIRETANQLQEILDELSEDFNFIPKVEPFSL